MKQKKKVEAVPAELISSTGWSKQWSVQGSASSPYKVSEHKDGSWACSCPAWTRNMPREDCKHILLVKLQNANSMTVKGVEEVKSVNSIQAVSGRRFR